jgi:hypothetical protein
MKVPFRDEPPVPGDGQDDLVLVPPNERPPVPEKAGKAGSEFIERLKNWRLNDLQQWMMGMARSVRGDQKAQIAWVNKYVQSIIDLFPKRRGRPSKIGGPQTAAERKRRQRQRETDWDWLPFPILAHAGYLVIEASPEDEIALFDIRRAHIVLGYELQRTMDAHHRDYPDQKLPADQPEQHGTEFEIELSRIKVLVLEYPDKVLYIAPAYEAPPTISDTLAGVGLSSLNRGLFLAQAPKGKGEPISGWRQQGYRTKTAEPAASSVDGDFSDYADEFATEDDHEGEDSGSVNPEGFGNRPRTEDELDEQIKNSEFDAISEKYGQDNEGKPEAETGVLKCRICGEVLEGNDDDGTLLFKHLEERHPDEYRRIGRLLEEQFEKKRVAEKKHELRQLEKQKRCLEDHDGMFARQLKAHGPGFYECGTCGGPLCKGTHVRQVEEVLAERNAYRAKLSYQEQLDASKRKPKPIYCKYCREPIFKTDFR